jgi:plasmid maintenance system antidote protein VapI
MKQRQTLREYMIKEIEAHMERTGEGMAGFCSRLGIQSQRIKGFMAGVTSIRVDTADKILHEIDNAKLEKR